MHDFSHVGPAKTRDKRNRTTIDYDLRDVVRTKNVTSLARLRPAALSTPNLWEHGEWFHHYWVGIYRP